MSTRTAVLFDLDGTLIDTAPDLVGAALDVAAELGVAPAVGPGELRGQVSRGARALVSTCLPGHLHADLDVHVASLLRAYEARGHAGTRFFPGVCEVLDHLDRHGMAWGIVTNKPTYLTVQVLGRLGLDRRAKVVVCGDTLPVRKPDPAPVHHAMAGMGLDSGTCVFVGDDLRDVEAGQGAGLPVFVAAYGYIDAGVDVASWGAEAILDHPLDLLPHLGRP